MAGEPPAGPFFHCAYSSGDTLESGFVSDPAFTMVMDRLIGTPLLDGNRIKVLLNGDEIFGDMLDLIRLATKTICLETYMWSSGEISDQFIEGLIERAENGVKIYVISDGFGALRMTREDMNRLKEAGIVFTFYKRAKWHTLKANFGHRTHRKVLVADGRVGVSGGFCIDDRWKGDGRSRRRWRDNGYSFQGPVVGQMQAVFVDHWLETTSQLLAGQDYFPDLPDSGNVRAQFYHGVPGDRYGSIRLSFFMGIATAESHIRIASAYFVPDDEAIALLIAARGKGIRVEVILPDISDTALGRSCSRSRLGPLLKAGVEIYRFSPAMYHCKYMIIDDCWTVAGSANFDSRSFSANDESNFNIYDRDFARTHIKIFEDDKSQSSTYTLDDHRNRAGWLQAADWFAGLFWKLV